MSTIITVETLVIVLFAGAYLTGHRGQSSQLQAMTATPPRQPSAVAQAPVGVLAPETADQTATYTSMLPIDLESPGRVPQHGQMFDACGLDKAGATVRCVKKLILLDVRCAIRNPGECEARVALSPDEEANFTALIGSGQRAHLFTPRR